MVLVLIDDLLFRSKISTTAKKAGVELAVVKTLEDALTQVRANAPALVLLDLDSQRTQPLELLRRLQQESDLQQIRTLGFVSHVHADLIREARQAGIGEVMARGAFAAALPDILQGSQS